MANAETGNINHDWYIMNNIEYGLFLKEEK